MTRKDYKLIAEAINAATEGALMGAPTTKEYVYGMRVMRAEIIDHLALAFTNDNPRFDEEKFKDAVRVVGI